MKVAPGKIMIRPLDDETEQDGIIMPDAQRSNQGIVVQVGKPQADLYHWFDILIYSLLRIHPCPFKVGMKVGIPRKPPVVDGLLVIWQHEVEYSV